MADLKNSIGDRTIFTLNTTKKIEVSADSDLSPEQNQIQ